MTVVPWQLSRRVYWALRYPTLAGLALVGCGLDALACSDDAEPAPAVDSYAGAVVCDAGEPSGCVPDRGSK